MAWSGARWDAPSEREATNLVVRGRYPTGPWRILPALFGGHRLARTYVDVTESHLCLSVEIRVLR
jgi:hypothetical protein